MPWVIGLCVEVVVEVVAKRTERLAAGPAGRAKMRAPLARRMERAAADMMCVCDCVVGVKRGR